MADQSKVQPHADVIGADGFMSEPWIMSMAVD